MARKPELCATTGASMGREPARAKDNSPAIHRWVRQEPTQMSPGRDDRITGNSRVSVFTILVLAVFLSLAPSLQAQQQFTPHIGYVYPAGGRQGSSFQVTVGGQFLNGVTNAYISGAGIKVALIEYARPLTPQEANTLRDKLKELQEKRVAAMRNGGRRNQQGGSQNSTNAVWTAQDEKTVAEIRRKLQTFVRRPPNPAIAETAILQVTMASDAEPGERELRLGTQFGLSNPLLFCVGQLPEFSKRASGVNEEPFRGKPFRNNNEQSAVPPTEMNITLPAVVNGQILPGGVDRYKFQARKGQQLVAVVSARALIPYLPDAVPGWFQATLALYDSKGKELTYDDRYRFHPDPVIYYEIPRDGEYKLEIRDSIYRGREDFVYRITVGELPFVTSIFPLGGPAGAQTTLEVKGWNLPESSLTQDDKDKAPGIYTISTRKEKFVSNPVPFAVDTLPECVEQEPNNSPAAAQPITLPIIVNGRIDQPGDWDVFRFEGRAGDSLVAEVYARRLDSPLDSVLKLTDTTGRQLAFNDDHEDKGSGLNTHHADSYLSATLPANGTYYLHLGDAQHQGGAEYAYRLRISAPRPDFALRVVPASISVRAGGNVPITVYALRRDGFSNEIAVVLKDAPAGFTLSGARVPTGQDKVRLTLSAPAFPTKEPVSLALEGHATIQGREVVRPAVPAEDMMQAFAYRHLVPAKELEVDVLGTGRFMARNGMRILGTTPVKIPAGGTARVRIATPAAAFMDRIQLELNEPPEGITLGKVSSTNEGAEIVLHSDAAKAKPGLKGNLIVSVFPGRNMGPAQNTKKQGNQRRVAMGTLPAIPFEVVGE